MFILLYVNSQRKPALAFSITPFLYKIFKSQSYMFSGFFSDIIKQHKASISRQAIWLGLKQGDLLRDRYRLIQVLSQSKWSETYLVRDLDRPNTPHCVIKRLKLVADDQVSLDIAGALFRREANTLEQLGRHDLIPRLLAYFQANRDFYLVQEFIDGLPLSSEIMSGLRWPESKVLMLLLEVLNILTFVHGRQVVHRNIKPSSLIRRRYDGRLSLIDFGAVQEIRAPNNITQINAAPMTVSIGNKGYMPREQFAGRPRLGSDIYALGVICAQVLTGIAADVLPKNNEDEILWQQHADVSEPLAKIITKMVRSHYRDRYRSAEEVLTSIEQAFPQRFKAYQVVQSQPLEDPFQAEDVLVPERYAATSHNSIDWAITTEKMWPAQQLKPVGNNLWEKINRIALMTLGGISIGGAIAQLPGAIILGLITTIFGYYSTFYQKSVRSLFTRNI